MDPRGQGQAWDQTDAGYGYGAPQGSTDQPYPGPDYSDPNYAYWPEAQGYGQEGAWDGQSGYADVSSGWTGYGTEASSPWDSGGQDKWGGGDKRGGGDKGSSSPSGSSGSGGSRSGSLSPSSGQEGKGKGRCCGARWTAFKKTYFYRIVKMLLVSAPGEYRAVKIVVCFPLGFLLALGLHFSLIEPLKMETDMRNLVGGVIGSLITIGFGLVTQLYLVRQVRCLIILVLPTFFGKSGRSYVATFALVYLIDGPVHNILLNGKETVRSMACVTLLLANHSLSKWELRLLPVKEAVQKMKGDGFMVDKVSSRVNWAFKPMRKELEEQGGVEEIKQDARKVDGDSRIKAIEEKHKSKPGDTEAQVVENEWGKKLDYRCEDVFSKGVLNCKKTFASLWDQCMAKLSIIGYLVCWPTKIDAFCELVKLMPGVVGMDCNSKRFINPGFGETYSASNKMVKNMHRQFRVNMQYKLVDTLQDLDFTSAEEARQRTMRGFEERREWMETFTLLMQRLLAFTFIRIFLGAFGYQKKYLSDFRHDNNYVTKYFRKIDARRKKQNKRCLLPLKRSEAMTMIFPRSPKLTKTEKAKLTKGTALLIARAIFMSIIVLLDWLLYSILDLLRRHGRVDYRQQGEHVIKIEVLGQGFISKIVKMFIRTINSKHEIDNLSSNMECLPNPYVTPRKNIVMIYLVFVTVWVFMYMEAYGMRLRRLICSFFYRKRQTSLLVALQEHFPRMCGWLGKLCKVKDKCLICEDSARKDFHKCQTPGCNFGYCPECWFDIQKRCYACLRQYDDESSSSGDDGDSYDDDERSTDDEDF